MTRHRLNRGGLLALLVSLPLLIAACGGDGNEDEDQIAEAIETAATTNKPENCTELQTQAFVEQIEQEKGEAAVEACRASAGEDQADSVEVSNIEVDGDRATAETVIAGSTFDGQTIEISLVMEGGQWKLDRIERFVEFDREAFRAALKEELTSGEAGLSMKQADCFIDELGSDQDLQDLFLVGDQSKFEAAFKRCARS